MKQEDEPGNSDCGQDGVMSGTAPKESVNKGSGDQNDASKVETAAGDRECVSGSTNTNDGENHAAEATRIASTSPDSSSCPNTSASSLDGVNSSSLCSEMENGEVRMENERSENEMQRSISSCEDSVAESNPRESLSPCSGGSTHSAVIGKSGRSCETSDKDHSHPPAAAVPACDGPQAEAADESMSESNPRDSFSSTSLSSTPGVSDRSGTNSENSDMDQSLLKPPSGTAPILDECPADVAGVGQVNCQPKLDSLSEQDTALQNARSTSMSKSKMTLRSGRVTHVESDPPKKHRDISKMKRQKSVGRTTKRRFSVDDQSHSSSEENPEKLLRLELSEALTSLHETEDSTRSMNAQSGDITNVSSGISRENTTSTNLEDSQSENERLLLANTDDAPVHEASHTAANEKKEAIMMNENSEREKFATVSSEAAHDDELNPVDSEEMLGQETIEETTYSESSANQPANSDMETGSLPPTTIGGDKDVRFCFKNTDTEMRAFDLPPTNERLLLANTDDAPVHEATHTAANEEKEAIMRNENLEREKLATVNSEVAHDDEQNSVDNKEMLDQETIEETTYSESSANQPANSDMETGSVPPTAIGGDKDVRFCFKSTDSEMRASNLPPASDSDVSVEDVKDSQPSGPESHMSCDSASSSDEKEFAARNSIETTTDKFVQNACDSFQECREHAVNNPSQQNFVEIPIVEISSGSGPVSPDIQKIPCSSAARGGFKPHSFFAPTGRRDPEKSFERNVALDTEVDVKRERMLEITHTVHHCQQQVSTAAPDSSTEGTTEEITSNTATKLQQQISSSISHSSETDATTDEPISCAYPGLSESTKKIINDIPHENKNSTSSNAQGTEDKTAEKVPRDTRHLESSEENGTSFSLSPDDHFEQRNLQIYRYITTNGGPDVRFSPYVTRRRPLRSRYSGGDDYRRVFFRRQRPEARQTDDDGVQATSGASASFGDTCSIS